MKTLKILAAALALALLLCGCGSAEPRPTVITYEEMTATLPIGFVKLLDQDFDGMVTFTYGSGDMLITGTREPLEKVLGQYPDMTLESYAQMIIDSNSLSCEAEAEDGYLTFTFETSDEEQTYRYVAAVYESAESFWVLQAGCKESGFAENERSFRECLASVEMNAEAD